MIDVAVAGGGPAGLVTALHAARAGLHAVVLEPRGTPIDKACGEGLMPAALHELRELGLDPPGMPVRGIRYTDGRHSAVADFRHGCGRGVRRTVLHEHLYRAARDAGVEVVASRVDTLAQDEHAVQVGPLRTRYLVAADGLHSPVRRMLGVEPAPARLRRWGVRAHFAVTPWTDLVEVYWSQSAEAYVTPVAADCVGVAVLGSRREPFAELVKLFPALAARLPGGPVGPVRGAGPMRQDVHTRVAGRVLFVGDAAGYLDALTGEGLAIAFRCARALIERIAQDRAMHYEHDYRAITRSYRLLTTALLWASARPALRRGLVPTAAALPPVFRAAVNQVAG